MKGAKSRNFRRRAGDEDEEEDTTITQSTAKTRAAPSPASRAPFGAAKSKESPSQPTTKSLLSFADDEDSSDSPFARPSSRPSSASTSRFFNKSAHKLTSSKERSAPHPPSSSVPSNVQPQAGSYTKEALLELQKNTKTLAAPARAKPKPEPVIVLKGLVKPIVANDLDSRNVEKNDEVEDVGMDLDSKSENLSVERDDALVRMGKVRLETGLMDEKELIPDKATIEAIRAKRERLRQSKAAAPDYIALDGGSNHGVAEGLSDEEPEFKGRIGFFAEKIGGGDKKGVFENFEERAVSKDRIATRGSDDEDDDEDEEDKMWEEEQVRKGLGKRLDDGVGSQGMGSSVSSVNSIMQSGGSQQSFGYSVSGTSGTYSPVQNVGTSVYDSSGGLNRGLFGSDMGSISMQAELTKKALNDNLRRIKESHGRTIMSLAKTDENLSSSLLNVTTLENSFSAAGEKFLFMQKLRDFVSVLCEFLQHKSPFIEELEEQMQNLHEERARAITERRLADNNDEMSEIEPVMIAVQAEFRKGGSNAAKVIAANAAIEANTRAFKSAPVELDEFGRDVNLQKRMDIARRGESRKRRRAKADAKKLTLENDNSYQLMEGELSTDESDNDSTAYESTHKQLLQVADTVFSDADEEYSQFSVVIEKFEIWKKVYASSYRDAYMPMSIPAIFSPYVRLELLKWDPLHEDADFIDMKWHSLLFEYGLPDDENKINADDAETDADANLVPELVEKLAVPILHHQLASCWDTLSTVETKYAVSAMNLVVRYVNLSSPALADLVAVLHDRLTNAVTDLMVPMWSSLEMNSVPNAARVAAYRFGTSVRLMRNICLWNKILAMPVLEKIALDQLLCSKILPHLLSIQSSVYDAITRTERVIASLYGVWAGPSVTGDRSRKLQPLVDYLLLIGKKLEKKLISNAMDTDTSKLVRRLKKMLVELNEYDHARALSRTFNLKEAL